MSFFAADWAIMDSLVYRMGALSRRYLDGNDPGRVGDGKPISHHHIHDAQGGQTL